MGIQEAANDAARLPHGEYQTDNTLPDLGTSFWMDAFFSAVSSLERPGLDVLDRREAAFFLLVSNGRMLGVRCHDANMSIHWMVGHGVGHLTPFSPLLSQHLFRLATHMYPSLDYVSFLCHVMTIYGLF